MAPPHREPPFWRDDRFWKAALQVAAIVVFVYTVVVLGDNLLYNLELKGIGIDFGWLGQAASFNLGESPIPFSRDDSYLRALGIGLLNSLRVIGLGLVLTTLLGLAAGAASFSGNWLLRRLSLIYVEVVRNTPLLLQLMFWYFPILLGGLPEAKAPMLLLGGWARLSQEGLVLGGLRLTLEFTALLVGLVVYHGAFIAEIVRGGIQAVPRGQWEAAAALGLHRGRTLRRIVIPQALQVIIPSLNSQYVSFAKNSSLAIAVGYPDLYATAQTSLNQTGRAVEVFLLLMLVYLGLNLLISGAMNQLNRLVQVKER